MDILNIDELRVLKVETNDLYLQSGKLEQRIQKLIELNNLKEKEEK